MSLLSKDAQEFRLGIAKEVISDLYDWLDFFKSIIKKSIRQHEN
jgi:hypothetical protein